MSAEPTDQGWNFETPPIPGRPRPEDLPARYLEPAFWSRRQAHRPARLMASFVLAGLFAVVMGWTSQVLHEPTASELDVVKATSPRYPEPWAPSYPADPAVLARIDFERVHAELLPAWVIATHHDPYTAGRAREERSFSALIETAGRDPNLSVLLASLRDRVISGVAPNGREIELLLEGWNGYMQDHGLAWQLAFDLVKSARGGRLYTRSYRILADTDLTVKGQPQHVRVLGRVDSTNVGEMFFGQTSTAERRSLVVSDRIVEFSTDRLWPLMDPAGDVRADEMDRAFAPYLRREVEGVLSSDTLEVLRRGAAERGRLVDRLAEIRGRRGCGVGIEVDNLPWNGLTPRGRAIAANAAARNAELHCKRLTRADADVLVSTSEALAGDARLAGALGELSAWLARAVSVHEARHLADGFHEGGSKAGVACDGCPPTLLHMERAEASAYVASMATPGVGFLSLYQACGLDTESLHASGAAVDFVVSRLVPLGCANGPPPELYGHAAMLEWALFDRVEPIVVPESFPRTLPLPSVRSAPPSPDYDVVAGGAVETSRPRASRYPLRAFL
jgi:hypothetical protein